MTRRESSDESIDIQRNALTSSLIRADMESPIFRQSSTTIASSQLKSDAMAAESVAVDTRVRILVVDDHRDLREWVTRLLRRWWSVEAVGDGLAAVEAIRRQRPALLLVDAAIAGIGSVAGVGLPQTLRDDSVTRSIPMIVVLDDGAENSGAMDCLVKPFSSRELIGRISARLEQQFGTSVQPQKPVRRLLNKVDLPIAVLRSNGLVVENANRAYLDLVGARDVIGTSFGEPLCRPREKSSDASSDDLSADARQAARRRTVLLHRRGEPEDTVWQFVLAAMEGGAGVGHRHLLAVGVEVTDDLRARRQREALAAEAVRANLAKDQFLAALGHELRNPLSPILTGLQLMRTKGLRFRELDVIERQVGAIVRLVDDLLDLSRIGRGQIDLQKEEIEIAEVVARAIESVGPLLKEGQHGLTMLVPESGLRVSVDPARMAQVIANLLTNAAKYSERGAEITVRAERREHCVRISTEDRGIGIAADMLPHVFEPFAPDRSAVRRSRGGLGLGLSIVRHLVEVHGGTVTAHSDGLGSGSTFSVELPAADGRQRTNATCASCPA